MSRDKERPAAVSSLRAQAEAIARGKAEPSTKNPETLPAEQLRHALQELHVHQIELEMQNEELRRSQAALEVARDRYFDLYDLTPVGYLTIGEQGLILEANLTAATLLGVPRGALSKQPLSRFILKDDQDIYYRHTKLLFETLARQSYDLRIARNDGPIFWARVEATTSQDAQGLTCGRLVLSDITEGKRAEAELREAQQRFEKLFRHNPALMALSSLPGQEFCDANDVFLDTLGYSRDEIIGRTVVELGLFPDAAKQIASTDKIRAEGRVKDVELQVRRKDGSILDGLFSGELIADQGRQYLLTVMRDVTDLKKAEAKNVKLEAQFAQAQKMESVGQLAGGVAHDFNNLLMGIMGYAELCRDNIAPDHLIREYLDEITKEATRSAHLTHQLLAFARRQIIAPKVLDLNDIAEKILKLLRRLIGEDITIKWRPGLAIWPVKMDPSQIDQILANLAVNARDAIGGEGWIAIETTNATLDQSYCSEHPGTLPGDYTLLTFSDTGCGMDPKTLAHIFEPFFTTKPVGKGTGMGLATVYGIVKQNEGLVDVCSELGKGTTFKIYLPRYVTEEVIQATAEAKRDHPRGSETILLVEDEKSVRVTTGLFLESLGYTLLVAETPEQALRLVAEHSGEIHLLITDVVMPGMNGRDLANRLAELRPMIKRLFVSGFTADIIAQRGILDNGVNLLTKPFSREQVARRIRDLLDSDSLDRMAEKA